MDANRASAGGGRGGQRGGQPCWSCGYDLTGVDAGQCPECGANYVTGRDVAELQERMGKGVPRRCPACGSARAGRHAASCAACGYEFDLGGGMSAVGAPERGGATGMVVSAREAVQREGVRERERRRGSGMTPWATGGGAFVLVVGLLAAREYEAALPGWAPWAIRFSAMAAGVVLLGWFLVWMLRRDADQRGG